MVSPSMSPRPPSFPLFPYTTLFRSSLGLTGRETFRVSGLSALQPAVLIGARITVEADGTSFETIARIRSEEHTSELQSPCNLVCRRLLEKHQYIHVFSAWRVSSGIS